MPTAWPGLRPVLCKLRYYKVNESVILWIESFLCNKKQRVEINGFYSDWADVSSGIPQGTILGPILFIICINDLPDVGYVSSLLTSISLQTTLSYSI